MAKVYSQREARRLAKRVKELEDAETRRRRSWAQEWVPGTVICHCAFGADSAVSVAIRTARSLKHAVVAVGDDTGMIRFVALPNA